MGTHRLPQTNQAQALEMLEGARATQKGQRARPPWWEGQRGFAKPELDVQANDLLMASQETVSSPGAIGVAPTPGQVA